MPTMRSSQTGLVGSTISPYRSKGDRVRSRSSDTRPANHYRLAVAAKRPGMRKSTLRCQLSNEMISPASTHLVRRVTATPLRLLETKESQTPFHRVMGGIRIVMLTGFGQCAVRGQLPATRALLRPLQSRGSQPDDPAPSPLEGRQRSLPLEQPGQPSPRRLGARDQSSTSSAPSSWSSR